jgi:catechol 2,3-dioxygenase-like lactoylglutathione lyase family enzyme
MIDHLTISVTDLQKSVTFYERCLKPLGYSLVMAHEQYRAFGEKGKPCLWIKHAELATPPMHLAFAASSRPAVDAFYKAAIAAGAQDFGKPGLRPHYHQHYYGAFVVDPNGHPIEAVCHAAPAAKKKPAAKKQPKKKKR